MLRLNIGLFDCHQKNLDMHVELSERDLRSGMRAYIRLNRGITGFYNKIDMNKAEHQPNFDALLNAIDAGDYDAEIFSHKDCRNYLLYAIENKMLPFWVGMTAYTYLTALAQFTDKQELRECDQDVKSPRDLQIVKLVEDGDLTKHGVSYLLGLQAVMSLYDIQINAVKLRQALLEMSAFEQQLMSVKFVANEKVSDVDGILSRLKRTIPFIHVLDEGVLVIPSSSLINCIFSQMLDKPMQMKPVFGSLTEKSRDELHVKDQHPVAIYSADVKSNIKKVHGYRCGPLPAWLHDVGHTFWANLLAYKERVFLQKELIPVIDAVIEKCDPNNLELFTRWKEALSDYDLTPPDKYMSDKVKRLQEYIQIWTHRLLDVSGTTYRDIDGLLLPALDEMITANAKAKNTIDAGELLKDLIEEIKSSTHAYKELAKNAVSDSSSAKNKYI